jgi:hypothetical protein
MDLLQVQQVVPAWTLLLGMVLHAVQEYAF